VDSTTLTALLGTAAFLGFFHTLTGPDHYVPFVAMSRIGRWSLAKTVAITLACGVGHVGSSIVLGVLGIALGSAVTKLQWFEGLRGDLAGWLLLGFGLAYTAWGVHRAIRNRPHTHVHAHEQGVVHAHSHGHVDEHTHVHAEEKAASMTPWILFTIFVFGPCEPLIPVLMYPAAQLSLWGIGLVALVFSVATLATMTSLVVVAYLGLTKASFIRLERYGHVAAGLALTACGLAIQLGL
jgi:nickel/cobalt transporter (NicO) family protein